MLTTFVIVYLALPLLSDSILPELIKVLCAGDFLRRAARRDYEYGIRYLACAVGHAGGKRVQGLACQAACRT